MIDDSALFHARAYDPVKAREYYLRTRKLKGRPKGNALEPVGNKPSPANPTNKGLRPANNKTSAARTRRAKLQVEKEALQKRLERLKEVLAQRVEEAQKLGGNSKPNESKERAKSSIPETKADKADRNEAEKSRKPLTAKQKADKARADKERYEKENPTTLSQDVEILREQIKDVKRKIKDALEASRGRNSMAAGKSVSRVRLQNQPSDGPRGR